MRESAILGPAEPRRLIEPILVSPEDLVAQDSFHRHLKAKLDVSLVHQSAREHYAERGRLSIEPDVFFKRST